MGRLLDLAIRAARDSSDPALADEIRAGMLSADPNDPVRGYFAYMLRVWDFSPPAAWNGDTSPNTALRRDRTYKTLELRAAEEALADVLVPFSDLRNTNIVIAEQHRPWYVDVRRARGFYWKAYRTYLEKTGWPGDSLTDLDEASDLIIERLSDPLRKECWQTKGLVVGYVQSGKTANFTAVVAKAADSGYRLIIIFAGTLDVLRAQTQRRIDKELIGKELIVAGISEGSVHDYAADKDWIDFVEHGAVPSSLEAFDIERLTGLRDDYRSLGRGIGALEFRGPYEDRPFNHPDNLRRGSVRIVIMKKHPSRIAALRKDLTRLQHTSLAQIPALIIDDESDQASVNTTKPKAGEVRARTATNREIVKLLGILPRAQYVGYTATPFANVFINPADAEDLFPKDFLIGLKRPAGYMGVRDFFDFDDAGRPVEGDDRPPGYESNERAFLRDVAATSANEDEEAKDRAALSRAIDSFVLSGAIKLYRESLGLSIKVRHHTMLVHRSTVRTEHKKDRDLVAQCFESAGFGSSRAARRLETLWRTDFEPVSRTRAGALAVPTQFAELLPFIEIAVSRAMSGSEHGPVRVVNAEPGTQEQAPDFDTENVWAILVGGAKLSRGFTVEGLTVSYFRRRVRTADTLMQTGRWFGFRRGYHDLVRVFFGRDEPDGRNRTFDLQEAFKAICMDEEMFRAQLRRYMSHEPGQPPITPKQIPPLVPQHLLQPSAKNKMYNAILRFENFGGEMSEETRLPQPGEAGDGARADNARLVKAILGTGIRLVTLGAKDDKQNSYQWTGFVATVGPQEFLSFLDRLRWSEGAPGYTREREYLRGTGDKDPEIARWVVFIPQREDESAYWPCCGQALRVIKRSRTTDARGNSRFKVFSEPRHRAVAELVAAWPDSGVATADTATFLVPGTAVALLYPAVESMPARPVALSDAHVNMGLSLFFPKSRIKETLIFGVRDETRPDDVVVARIPEHT